MIERTCELGDACRGPKAFTVEFESDPKRLCSVACRNRAIAAKRKADGSAKTARAQGAATLLERRRRRVMAFIDGLSPLEIFFAGIRLGYARKEKEVDDDEDDLGDIGRLTQEALSC